jgi:Tol biopolymer transport system component
VLLSPDGTLLVFAALPTPEARPHLYVRRLDQLEASLLPGTEGARNPFFSPDGRWVGFVAEGKLKKVSVNGGGAVPIAGLSVVGYHGGWWADDGSIVFVQDEGKGARLVRVSSSGGTPVPLAGADPARVETWPQVLPSGKAVLYSVSTMEHEGPAILARPLSGGPAKVLVRDAYHGRYLPSGHLVFIRDDALYAAAFDLDRLAVVGEPTRAVDSVQSSLLTGGARFSVSDQGTLAYVPGAALRSTIQWMDKSARLKPLREVPGNYSAPDFSPDGRRLAMDISDGREQDVWIYEWATERLTRLTFGPAPDSRPVWTPDGKRIAFSRQGRNGVRNLYWQRADGTGEAEPLTESENVQWLGSWHPDGRHLAFSEMATATARPDIMILEMEGSEEKGWKPGKITRFFESPYVDNLPAFSPDGRWLAYMSNQTGRFEVYVRPFPGPGGIWQVSTQSGRYPVWSRVRRELFFVSNDETIMVVPYTVEGREFRAERPRLWSEARVPSSQRLFMTLHPDGERFALVMPLAPIEARRNKAVLVSNFFDYLRSVAPAGAAAR